MKELTLKQQEILTFIKTFLKKHGYPPTVREIGERFGFLWSAARGHLKALERKGYIKINPSTSRGIEIHGFTSAEGIMIPVAGKIRAGRPLLAVEESHEHICIDKALFRAENSFSLKVIGDSMREAGIFDGDYVIVKPQSTIKNGEIGIALVEDEATVKRIYIRGNRVVLKPENKEMEPITYPSEEVTIIGKVIGVVRKL